MPKISHPQLLDLLTYDPASGVFISRVYRGPLVPGQVVGQANSRGYLRTTIYGRHYYLHRLAWFYVTRSWPDKIDHRNGVFGDNRFKNLRPATTRQNGRNRKIDARNKSGVTGVCWLKTKGKWRADIMLEDGRLVLGCYKDLDQAVLIRYCAETFFFAEFRRGAHAD